MKIARILVSLALLVVVAGAAHAQGGCYTLSWNNCGVPQVPDQMYGAPGIYKLVLSFFAIDKPNVGHDTNIIISPNVQDAWRFDDIGCQGGAQLTLANVAFTKSCPAMRGLNPLAITFYGYNTATRNTELRMGIAYDMFTPNPAVRYTGWIMSYDHTYSVAGPSDPGLTCGGVLAGLAFDPSFCQMLQQDGLANNLQPCPGDARATWQGGPVVPTVPASWGKVKGLYR